MTNTDWQRRAPGRSPGGQVVEVGLRAQGFDLESRRDVVLVETTKMRARPFNVVLAQNAWNVIPVADFVRHLADYPRAMWPRFLARRAVALANLRRAGTVVCLTEAMAELCRAHTARTKVAGVTVPVDLLRGFAGGGTKLPSGTLLVPGTVTWYKHPHAALEVFTREARFSQVLFAGGDDGSGAWLDVQAKAAQRGIPCSRAVLSRPDMREACRTAEAVVVASQLESLSFSLAEALFLAPQVYASRIPAHREVARRLHMEPDWMDDVGIGRVRASALQKTGTATDVRALIAEWTALGQTLGLARTASGGAREA